MPVVDYQECSRNINGKEKHVFRWYLVRVRA